MSDPVPSSPGPEPGRIPVPRKASDQSGWTRWLPGLQMLRQRGLFIGVGLPPTSDGNFEISPFEFFWRDPTLIFSAVGTVQEMRELVDLAAAGKVTTHVSRTGSLSEVPQIFEELEAGGEP